ncbi:uncharacterized protein LOC120286842 isoform X3 [Eucalyptus grandis]|uniref:uncharacterized protein LOC120286842 isoform X3 n=1 Tax=Eucalyptus grandis TaxID=71139 RepID=UPI00192E7F1D|nr:uncharacterized protein LOC120286842 isoform X3 [Eucalyptus grandis]
MTPLAVLGYLHLTGKLESRKVFRQCFKCRRFCKMPVMRDLSATNRRRRSIVWDHFKRIPCADKSIRELLTTNMELNLILDSFDD